MGSYAKAQGECKIKFCGDKGWVLCISFLSVIKFIPECSVRFITCPSAPFTLILYICVSIYKVLTTLSSITIVTQDKQCRPPYFHKGGPSSMLSVILLFQLLK